MDIREHLVSSRNDLAEIEALTRNLGNEPSLEQIESVLRRRDTLVTRMKFGERQLSSRSEHWSAEVARDPFFLQPLLDESKALLQSVAEIDNRLSGLIESRMNSIRRQLSALYHTSRAAYSYIGNIRRARAVH
jgi:hypothetical protein